MKEFDENKVKRDELGRFTDKPTDELKKMQMIDLKKLTSIEDFNENEAEDINLLLGKEYKGYKGKKAIEKLMSEKNGHIKGAFFREDIGDIDLLWGNENFGLNHIIQRRAEQSIDIETFLQDLDEVIEKGNFRKKNNRGNFEFMLNKKIAVISPELKGNKLTFLLTAFKTHSKK